MTSSTQLKTTGDNDLSVQETSKPKSMRLVRSLPKTHHDYWKSRLFKNTYTRDGARHEINEFSVKVQHLGVRKTFSLATSNREAAAVKARELYLTIVAKGWEAALAQYNPNLIVPRDGTTILTFLDEIEKKSGLKSRTFRNYATSFRTIVGQILRLKDGPSKFDYRGGGSALWRKQIDDLRLDSITPDKIQQWKVGFIKAAEQSPTGQQSARRTVNSYIRCARSLFSKQLLKFVKCKLPTPLPFEGIELEKTGSMKYLSNIDIQTLVPDAKKELKADHPESYKALLLGLFCGLRRAEMDCLEKNAIDWTNCRIRVANTDVLSVKTDGSEASIDVDAELLNELRPLVGGDEGRFVLQSHLPPRPSVNRAYYRCDHHFQHLTGWLRKKGITANKPLHELRKEFGSIVNQKFGIYAASEALRHSDISTSVRHYVAKRERISPQLGNLLSSH